MGGLFGGGGGGSSGGTVNNVAGASQYVPTAQPQADAALQQLFTSLAAQPNYPLQNLPTITSYTNQLMDNPYTAIGQGGADQAGGYLTGLGPLDVANANTLQPYVQETLNTAFDPQNALFNQESQKLQDQVNATNSMYGLGSSPVGASILDDQLGKFDINWQNNQLNRQISGANAAGTLTGDVNNLMNAGATAAQQSGSIPQNQFTGNIGKILQALSSLSAAGSSITEQPTAVANLLQSYLGLGQTANRNNLAAQQSGLSDLASGASGAYTLGKDIFGGSSSSPVSSIGNAFSGFSSAGAAGYLPGYIDSAGLSGSTLADYGIQAGASDFAASSALDAGTTAAASSFWDFLPAIFAL